MSYTLEQFSAACRRILTDDRGPEGRRKVCALVQDVLKDDVFIATHLGDDGPERKILYEDLHSRPRLSGGEGEPAARSRSVLGDLRPGPG